VAELSLTFCFVLFATGLMAGVSNAVAGGGTFFTFPALLASGLPPVIANASNSLAVWPGHVLALVGYRKELGQYSNTLAGSIIIALVGGATGAGLLASVGNQAFAKLIPPLILIATLLFAFGPRLNGWLQARAVSADFSQPKWVTRVCELVFAVYGGFFGAGLGVMLMAGLQMLGVHDPHANNALKNLLAAVVNTISVVVLIATGLIAWPHTAFAFVGAICGGLIGGHISRRIPAKILRWIVIGFGGALTVYYLGKYYGG
jgi:uncharacterized membrane protein YfcA